jgi:hypothetical protein
MTFQELSEENARAVEGNLAASYQSAADRCKIIVDLAGSLEFD